MPEGLVASDGDADAEVIGGNGAMPTDATAVVVSAARVSAAIAASSAWASRAPNRLRLP